MGKFKNQMVVVLIFLVAVTWVYQEAGRPKEVVEGWISYITSKDYGIGHLISSVWEGEPSSMTVSTFPLQLPCNYTEVVRHFGWYYNQQSGEQAFNPGVVLRIDEDTQVYPVLRGEVSSLSHQENGYQVILEHGDSMVSIIRGLQKVEVSLGEAVEETTLLGLGSELLYIEIRDKDGPINPEGLLNINKST
ncbi:MAG: peptidoglycan DD-metalloendopeptidase family protein [Syntrophomonadaceae bacterium]|nr:peptidoglycan DD-metalloendopeptidase family protein [Syntrophomonadaceae bacterium]